MKYIQNLFFSLIIVGLLFFVASCEEKPKNNLVHTPQVITGKIPEPIRKQAPIKEGNKKESIGNDVQKKGLENKDEENIVQHAMAQKAEHYDSQGKIDPFKPLIQEEPEIFEKATDKPPRILTPLEKFDLSQMRLVAVIIMDNKKIAMVEEATGKGYEVGIGTYIGKNQGKITEINNSSIIVTDLIKDYKGRITERNQEIKLHKNDNGE